jgi:O-antigen/teichoic acid export membrane protein
VSLTQITEVLTSTTDTLLVGRWLGPTALGQYSRATLLVELPVVQVSSATSRVLTPALSRLQDDEQRFASSMLRAAGIQALVVLTPVLLACSASTTLVEVVLGGGWGISADVLPVVACASGLSLLTHIVATAAEAKGQVVSKLGVQLATLSVLVGSLAVTGTSGPTPVRLAVAWLVSESVRHLLYWRFLLPRLGVSRRQLATKFSGALMFAVVTAFPVFVAHQVLGMRGLAVVGLSAGIGAVAAVGLAAKGWLHEVGEDARYLKSAISGR